MMYYRTPYHLHDTGHRIICIIHNKVFALQLRYTASIFSPLEFHFSMVQYDNTSQWSNFAVGVTAAANSETIQSAFCQQINWWNRNMNIRVENVLYSRKNVMLGAFCEFQMWSLFHICNYLIVCNISDVCKWQELPLHWWPTLYE